MWKIKVKGDEYIWVYSSEVQNNAIQQIYINKNSINLTFPNKKAAENFKSKTSLICGAQYTQYTNLAEIVTFYFAVDSAVKLDITLKKKRKAILKEIFQLEPLTKEIQEDLCAVYNFNYTIFLTIEDLQNYTILEAIELAKTAQAHSAFELIWQLAKKYYANTLLTDVVYKIDSNTLYSLLLDISKLNPYYKKANDLCVDLLMRIDVTNFNFQEKQEHTELIFHHALLGTRQTLTDRLYHQLCGYPFSLEVLLKNIQGESSTLLALARQIREMRITLKNLEEKPNSNEIVENINVEIDQSYAAYLEEDDENAEDVIYHIKNVF
ncbi:MAG: hypothetical protein HYX60_05495 [Legionella longbeachae]|nr:hypothetical protein [Legionella longbeachae]